MSGDVSFGELGEDGRLADSSGHELWTMAVYIPRGREGEACEWMNAHGLEVYRMWQPEQMTRRSG